MSAKHVIQCVRISLDLGGASGAFRKMLSDLARGGRDEVGGQGARRFRGRARAAKRLHVRGLRGGCRAVDANRLTSNLILRRPASVGPRRMVQLSWTVRAGWRVLRDAPWALLRMRSVPKLDRSSASSRAAMAVFPRAPRHARCSAGNAVASPAGGRLEAHAGSARWSLRTSQSRSGA